MQQPSNQEYSQTTELDKFPFEYDRVIDELVEFWQTHKEPSDLTAHIRSTLKQGCTSLTSFFAKVRDDLRTDKHSKYTASSAFEFRHILETEFLQLYRPYAERQAKEEAERQEQAKAAEVKRLAKIKEEIERQAQIRAGIERQAKNKAENERRVRADFDALGELMEKTIDRKELIELGRKRQDLAPYVGIKHPYENVCWKCRSRISSTIHIKCKVCGWYICNGCGSCKKPVCDRSYTILHEDTYEPFLPDYPDDLS